MAKKVKHTPGPWRVSNDVDVQSGPQGALAYVSTAGARGRTLDEAKANARLIAAAPELLEALRAIVQAWRTVPENVQVPDEINVNELWDAAEEAIARATRGQS